MESSIKCQTPRDDTAIISPGRALDNSNAHEMVNTLTDLHQRGYKYIILDMNELAFLSSAGVGSILGTVESFREVGGDIVLCHVSEPISHVLVVLDLADYLTIRKTRDQALVECQSG